MKSSPLAPREESGGGEDVNSMIDVGGVKMLMTGSLASRGARGLRGSGASGLVDPLREVFNALAVCFSCARRKESNVTPQFLSLLIGPMSHARALALSNRALLAEASEAAWRSNRGGRHTLRNTAIMATSPSGLKAAKRATIRS
jgi:hypothetical protein